LQDPFEFSAGRRHDEQMHMVRHNDKVARVVALTIIQENPLPHNIDAFVPSQRTGAETAVQASLYLPVETLMKTELLGLRQLFESRPPRPRRAVILNPARFQPQRLFLLPLLADGGGDRVIQTKRNEIRASRLPPVRQIARVYAYQFVLIEGDKRRSLA